MNLQYGIPNTELSRIIGKKQKRIAEDPSNPRDDATIVIANATTIEMRTYGKIRIDIPRMNRSFSFMIFPLYAVSGIINVSRLPAFDIYGC